MSQRIIKLKESDIVKLVKRVISENQVDNYTSQAKLVAFKCYKPGVVQITIAQCGTIDKGCYTFIHPKREDKNLNLQEELKGETWEVTCEDLKKGIVYNRQGYIIRCPELAKYLIYKSNCCGGGNGGDDNGGGRVGGGDVPIEKCTTIRCKVESEVDKCTKKKYIWREVKKAFEEEFPAGAPSGSSERNQQLWKEWKKGWRPKCKDGSDQSDDTNPIYAG